MKQIVTALAMLILLAVSTAHASEVEVSEQPQGPEAQRIGPPTLVGFHAMPRYVEPPPGPKNYPVPDEPLSRDTYMRWIEDTGHLSYADSPKRGRIGPRHLTPVLAKFVQTGDRKWAEACIAALKDFDRWIREEVEEKGWHAQSLYEPWHLAMYRRHLLKAGVLNEQRDTWFRDMILFMNRHIHVWGTKQHYFRGNMHRAQAEGLMKTLAATWYPDAPEAERWKAYGQRVWNDFWRVKDVPPNDTGYFFVQLFPLAVGNELLGRDEFFTHPDMKRVWDRVVHEVSPDGAVVSYGHGAWNAQVGSRIVLLELLAAKTRDGRYRYVAQKLMNYLRYQWDAIKREHWTFGPDTTERLAIAYLVADDTVQPVRPDAASRIVYRKEAVRLRNKQVSHKYFDDLDPAPDRGDPSGLPLLDRTMPSKPIPRSGWDPGDFFVLVDLYPRHDANDPGAILGMTRWAAPLTQTEQTKFASDEGRLLVRDLSGTAPTRFQDNPDFADPYFSEVEVTSFHETKRATFASVEVTHYQGFPVRYTRDFLFVKNRFLLSRETATFEEGGWLCQVTPRFNTQNVGPQVGTHWANTFMAAPFGTNHNPMKMPPYDLLVYFAHRPGCRLQVLDRGGKASAQLRYLWQGVPETGESLLFTEFFYPHAPSLKTAGAEGVEVLADTPETTVLKCTLEADRVEWLVWNPAGRRVEVGGLTTDARSAYVDVVKGRVRSLAAVEATTLSLDGKPVVTHAERKTTEK